MYFGIRAVTAKSIERVHLDNLVIFGIAPMTFANRPTTRIKDDALVVEDTREVLASGTNTDHFLLDFTFSEEH
jgi:aconitate hydratase